MWLERGGKATFLWGKLPCSRQWRLLNTEQTKCRNGIKEGSRPEGGTTPTIHPQIPPAYFQKGPEKWTAHANSFTWTVRNLSWWCGKVTYKKVPPQSPGGLELGLVISPLLSLSLAISHSSPFPFMLLFLLLLESRGKKIYYFPWEVCCLLIKLVELFLFSWTILAFTILFQPFSTLM